MRTRLPSRSRSKAQNVGYSNPDYYVNPKKLYPYDLKSAKQLTNSPSGCSEGFRYAFYPYDAAAKRVDFPHEAGQLLPIEKLEIKDVVTAKPAGAEQRQQVMAVFQKEANVRGSDWV